LPVKFGFPPKEVTAPDSATLDSIGIKHGETLLLEVKPAAASEVEPVILRRHAVPDDNSCLFASVKAVVGYQGDTQSLRTVVVQEIKRHPEDYSEAVLGKSADLYCAWILKRESWGGRSIPSVSQVSLLPLIVLPFTFTQAPLSWPSSRPTFPLRLWRLISRPCMSIATGKTGDTPQGCLSSTTAFTTTPLFTPRPILPIPPANWFRRTTTRHWTPSW